MSIVAFGRIADKVVTIMTQGHIHNATLSKVLQILYVILDGKTVFNTQKDALLACFFVTDDILLCSSQSKAIRCAIYDLLDFIEDAVSIFLW